MMWLFPGHGNRERDMSESDDRTGAPYGWMLAIAAALSLAFAMVHPQVHGHDLAGVFAQLREGARFNSWVHGILMALAMVLVAGFAGLSRRLGFGRPEVTLGLTFYAMGTMAMMGAAVINGFALSIFAGRYDAGIAGQEAALGAAFNLAGSIAATWAAVGAAGMSGGILAWSLRLVALPGSARIVGAGGILLGLATIALLVAGVLILNVHGFLLLVLSQTIWTIAIGVLLIRQRL
jgi:hypothetical protein